MQGPLLWIVHPGPHNTLGIFSWPPHSGPHDTLGKVSPSPYSGPYNGIISHSPHLGPLPWIIHPGPDDTLGTFSWPPLAHSGPHDALGPTATCWDVSPTVLLGTFPHLGLIIHVGILHHLGLSEVTRGHLTPLGENHAGWARASVQSDYMGPINDAFFPLQPQRPL